MKPDWVVRAEAEKQRLTVEAKSRGLKTVPKVELREREADFAQPPAWVALATVQPHLPAHTKSGQPRRATVDRKGIAVAMAQRKAACLERFPEYAKEARVSQRRQKTVPQPTGQKKRSLAEYRLKLSQIERQQSERRLKRFAEIEQRMLERAGNRS